ncbi:MAG: ribosomal protein [Verrucomicrobiales bacterium]|nr:ribosomal protein [Verrucomicrobiales bacterium]
MRNSARKRIQNTSTKSRLHTLEKSFATLATAGKKAEAATALKTLVSAFDKAAKTGVVPKGTSDRKKSRLTLRLSKIKA